MEFMLCCPTCTEDLVFEGGRDQAEAECPNCGVVSVNPDELIAER